MLFGKAPRPASSSPLQAARVKCDTPLNRHRAKPRLESGRHYVYGHLGISKSNYGKYPAECGLHPRPDEDQGLS
jgi:hypothetical protein